MSSPTILLFGDLHFRKGHLIQGKECCEALIKTAKKYQPDLIVLLGDVLHTHEMVYVKALKLLEELLDELRKIAKVKVLVGNHDFTSASENQSTEHPLGAFKKWKDVEIIDHSTIVDQFSDSGYRLILTPYIPYEVSFSKEMKNLFDDYDMDSILVLAHQPFYPIDPKAEKWPENYPLVISGHIHDRMNVGDNIYYTGSSSQVAMDEKPDKFGCLVTLGSCISHKPIPLDVRSIAIIRTSYDDFSINDIRKVAKTHDVRLIIASTREEKDAFLDSDFRAELLAAGVKTTWDLPKEKLGSSVVKRKVKKGTFPEILKILVANSKDQKIQEAYEKIYGVEEE